MYRRVKVDLRDKVAVISLALAPSADPRAPDPGFEAALCAELAAALAEVRGNHAAAAVLLRAGAGGWPLATEPCADRDVPKDGLGIATLASALDTLEKPVVLLLSGRIGSGALALALAAGWRIAAPDCVLAPPEPSLATLPEAGVLVRAARRAGAAAALRLAQPERPISAAEAVEFGLIDGVVEAGDADAAALSVARSLVARPPADSVPPRRVNGAGIADQVAFLAAITAARGELAQMPPPLRDARARAIDCVEAALLLPEPEALQFAEVAREDLDASPQSRALVHIAVAERRAVRRAVGAAFAPSMGGARIGFWEAGAAGVPLAEALITAGFSVVVGARDEGELSVALASVARRLLAAETGGVLDAAAREAAWARIEGAAGAVDLAGCAWVLSRAEAAAALPADLPLVLAGEPSPAFPEAPALHLVGPSLIEVMPAPGAAPAVAAGVAATAARAHFVVLKSGAGPLGITARLRARAYAAAERAVLAGARPDQVDAALGMTDPPFRRADRVGLARVLSDLRVLGRAPGPLSLRLLAERLIGKPTTFYRGDGEPGEHTVAEVTALLPGLRAEAGIAPRPLTPAQIRARVMAELADEGAAMLQSAQAGAAGDIDVAAILGLGLPRVSGGPMHAADIAGLLATRSLLRTLGNLGAPQPEALWDVLIRNGRHFADLDQPDGR